MNRLLLPLLAAVALAGCGPTTSTSTPSGPKIDPPAHNHPTVGPNGGTIVEWGDEDYHLEFVPDRTTGTATVYVLDESAAKPKAVPSKSLTLSLPGTPPAVVTLEPKPQDADPPGRSSRFVGQHEALKKPDPIAGSISGEVGTEQYTGDFKEKPARKR